MQGMWGSRLSGWFASRRLTREVFPVLLSEIKQVGRHWFNIKESSYSPPDGVYSDRDWRYYSWAKGNGRWANGLAHDVETLDPRQFLSVDALCDHVAHIARTRFCDPDHEDPKAAREHALRAVEAVRSRFKR